MTKLRNRVFVASLADWLDPEVPIEWLADLLDLIRRCPHLDFLMLTKRPELFTTNEPYKNRMEEVAAEIAECDWGYEEESDLYKWVRDWIEGNPPANVWIGTSVEDQKRADERIPALLEIPARVRFLSCEPLLGPVEFSNVTGRRDAVQQLGLPALAGIDWVICGGESGPKARPMHPDWARSLRDQCQPTYTAFFMKQMGGRRKPFPEIPEDLMVREFPKPVPF